MTSAHEHFQAALDDNDFQSAAKVFCTMPLNEQSELMARFKQNSMTRSEASAKPSLIALLQRQLKPEVSFDDFYQAWQPHKPSKSIDDKQRAFDYFNLPIRVINAQSVDDPSQLISLSLIACDDYDQLLDEFTERQSDEQARAKSIATVADKLADNQLFEILSDDLLGDKKA